MGVKLLVCLLFLSAVKANEVFLVFYPGPTLDNSVRYTINNFGDIFDHPSFVRFRRTAIFSYGNLQSLSHPYVKEVIEAYVLQGDTILTNFVAVDYSQSWILDGGVQRLGDQLGVALLNLFNRGYSSALTHLIGFGTAAHIVSVASINSLRNGHLISRVTGLSPTSVSNGINPNVASYVDVIHSNIIEHGNQNSQGMANFFVNGGAQQPWCGNDHVCSHDSAMRLYAESVDVTLRFPSRSCQSWESFCRGDCNNNAIAHMGWLSHSASRGSFFLQTNTRSPFSKNDANPFGC